MRGNHAWQWIFRCPHCHSRELAFVTSVSGGRFRLSTRLVGIYQCTDCRWVWLNPAPTGDLGWLYPNSYLAADDSQASSSLAGWYRQDQYAFDFRVWEQASGKSLSSMESYLDVGAGSGERVAYLSERGVKRIVGIDRYDQQPISAKSQLRNQQLEQYFPTEKYSVVGLFHVLEHVPNSEEMVQHINEQILAEGGELIIQVPNFSSVERKIFGKRWYGLDVPRHLWHFTPETLTRLMSEAGLEILAVEKRNAWLHPVTTIASVYPRFDIQYLWVKRAELSRWQYWMYFLGWCVGTALTIPWTLILSLLGQGSMLTVVGRKRER